MKLLTCFQCPQCSKIFRNNSLLHTQTPKVTVTIRSDSQLCWYLTVYGSVGCSWRSCEAAIFVAVLMAQWIRHCTPTQARQIGVMLRLLVQTQQGTGWFLGIHPLQWCI